MECKKCNKHIPGTIVIEGKRRNLAGRKYCLECSPFGKHNTFKLEQPLRKNVSKKGIVTYKCSKCEQTFDISKFFIKKNGYPFCYCKSCWNKIIAARLVEKKRKLRDMFGGKCQLCGYSKYDGALEFHHKDPNKKEFDISTKTLGFSRIVKEAKKCVLLCSNCHKELHAGLVSI